MKKGLIIFGLILFIITTSFVLADNVCYNSVATIPATCTGGTITQDTTDGSCRTLICSNNNDSLQILTCEKPTSLNPDHFEMYKQEQVGTSVSSICLGNACISSNGFVNQNFPVCIENSIPPVNTTNNTNQTNTTSQISVSLSIAPWYPKGNDYVLSCNAQGFTATSYDWIFGDGQQLYNYNQNNIYHIYNNGSYDASCIAKGSTQQGTGTLHIVVGTQNPPINNTGNQTNQTNITRTCFSSVQYLPATCTGGTINRDDFNRAGDSCRYISCSDPNANSVNVQICDRPNPTNAQYFEMYRQSFTGTPPQICLGNDCLKSGWGYQRGSSFPICVNPIATQPSITLTSIPEYSQDLAAVFLCNATGNVTAYLFSYGDNTSEVRPTNISYYFSTPPMTINPINNMYAYHLYAQGGNYLVNCAAQYANYTSVKAMTTISVNNPLAPGVIAQKLTDQGYQFTCHLANYPPENVAEWSIDSDSVYNFGQIMTVNLTPGTHSVSCDFQINNAFKMPGFYDKCGPDGCGDIGRICYPHCLGTFVPPATVTIPNQTSTNTSTSSANILIDPLFPIDQNVVFICNTTGLNLTTTTYSWDFGDNTTAYRNGTRLREYVFHTFMNGNGTYNVNCNANDGIKNVAASRLVNITTRLPGVVYGVVFDDLNHTEYTSTFQCDVIGFKNNLINYEINEIPFASASIQGAHDGPQSYTFAAPGTYGISCSVHNSDDRQLAYYYSDNYIPCNSMWGCGGAQGQGTVTIPNATIPPTQTYYTALQDIPATCIGGTITSDVFNGGRNILCENAGKTLSITAWNKPDVGIPQYFEMYKFLETSGGSGLKICLLSTCISGNGFAQSPNYPIYDYNSNYSSNSSASGGNYTNSTAPTNSTTNSTTNTTTNSTNSTTNVSINFSITPSGGFFSDNVDVTVTRPSGHTIVYTLDGSNPSENGIQLSGSTIAVQKRSDAPSSFATNPETSLYHFTKPLSTIKATILRVVELAPNGSIVNSTSIAYFIGLNQSNFTLPVFSIVLEDSDIENNHTGMFVKGDVYYNYLAANPGANPLDPFTPADWNGNDSFRHNADFQLFVNGSPVLTDRALFYPMGRWSVAEPEKSSKLNFDKTIGSATISYPIFGNQSEIATDKILFKTGGQDFKNTGIRDCVINQAIQGLNMINTKCGQIDLFINGEYYGVMGLQQQIDAKFLSLHYGGKKGDYVVLEQDGLISDGNKTDNQDYFALRNWLQNTSTNLSDPVQYAKFTSRVNPDSLIDFISSEAFYDNIDYPNDYMFWRVKTPTLMKNGTLNDGRWVFIMKDVDSAAGLYPQGPVTDNNLNGKWGYNFTGYLQHTNGEWAYLFFVKAMENPAFKQKFIDRNMFLLNTTFGSEYMNATIDTVANSRRPEISKSQQRWPDFNPWEQSVLNMKNWIAQRDIIYRSQILSLSSSTPPPINNTNSTTVSVADWYPKMMATTTDYVFVCNTYSSISRFDWYTFKDGTEISKTLNQVSNSIYEQYPTGTGSYVQTCVIHDGNVVKNGSITIIV